MVGRVTVSDLASSRSRLSSRLWPRGSRTWTAVGHWSLSLLLPPGTRRLSLDRHDLAEHRGVRRTTLATCGAPATRATRTEVPPLVRYTKYIKLRQGLNPEWTYLGRFPSVTNPRSIARHRPMSAGIDSAVRFYGAEPHYLVGVPYRLLSSIG